MNLYLKIFLITLASVMGFVVMFSMISNAQYRSENRELKKDIKRLEIVNQELSNRSDSLVLASLVRVRDDSVRMAQVSKLKEKLESLNNRNIVTVYEDYHTVTNLDLDGDISLLSRFLDAAKDSASR